MKEKTKQKNILNKLGEVVEHIDGNKGFDLFIVAVLIGAFAGGLFVYWVQVQKIEKLELIIADKLKTNQKQEKNSVENFDRNSPSVLSGPGVDNLGRELVVVDVPINAAQVEALSEYAEGVHYSLISAERHIFYAPTGTSPFYRIQQQTSEGFEGVSVNVPEGKSIILLTLVFDNSTESSKYFSSMPETNIRIMTDGKLTAPFIKPTGTLPSYSSLESKFVFAVDEDINQIKIFLGGDVENPQEVYEVDFSQESFKVANDGAGD